MVMVVVGGAVVTEGGSPLDTVVCLELCTTDSIYVKPSVPFPASVSIPVYLSLGVTDVPRRSLCLPPNYMPRVGARPVAR